MQTEELKTVTKNKSILIRKNTTSQVTSTSHSQHLFLLIIHFESFLNLSESQKLKVCFNLNFW